MLLTRASLEKLLSFCLVVAHLESIVLMVLPSKETVFFLLHLFDSVYFDRELYPTMIRLFEIDYEQLIYFKSNNMPLLFSYFLFPFHLSIFLVLFPACSASIVYINSVAVSIAIPL